MTDTSQPGQRVDFLAPALVVSIIIAIFAVVTQLLEATGAVWLSSTQQLTMWLVAAGLIVLLWIAYMICGAYVTARADTAEAEARQARAEDREAERIGAAQVPGNSQPEDGNAGKDGHAWFPPSGLRLLGTEHSANMEDVFPDGCYLEPDPISLGPDILTGEPVYKCKVVDRNLALKDREHEPVVNIPADRKPDTEGWPRYALVEFENLTVVPYETNRNPIRYTLRATGVHLAA